MNPQEDIWQHTRQRVIHDHYLHMGNLLTALEEFHHRLEQYPERVLRLLTEWARHTANWLGLTRDGAVRPRVACPSLDGVSPLQPRICAAALERSG